MHNFGFIFKTIVFTVILGTALTKNGSLEGIHQVFYVKIDNMSLIQVFNKFQISFFFTYFILQILGNVAFVMYRGGLIFPVGYMTYSSCLPQRTTMRGESVVICTCGTLLTIFNLMVVFGVMGVLSTKMGVDLFAVYVPRNYYYSN